ncbi:MAG TPA: NAD(P)/FAD-dependent oxidoreductase [Candidatus Caenarcaniphilales bacterium]|nr:NAD(P)/FAD-dependent oxidoreductase [Candidatus Caenarcaniphilales bacterium]
MSATQAPSGTTQPANDATRTRVAIVGGGFGGLYAARALADAPVRLTLIDRRNFHLFQPLLYQVATGVLSPGDIAAPLRSVLRSQANTTVLLGDVRRIDVEARTLQTAEGVTVHYDILVLASGARHSYFGHDEWAEHSAGLKTIEDAVEIRRQILLAYEAAEQEADQAARAAWMTFVVVGGGPTGAELAGALGEIANQALRRDFRHIWPPDARIYLLEGVDRVLPTYPASSSAKAARDLARLGVEVRTGTMVTGIDEHGVTVSTAGETGRIEARTVLWAAGVQASSLGRLVAESTGAELDRAGRVVVEPDLTVPGHPEIFVIGDLAVYTHQTGSPLPGVAPVAMQQAGYVADTITRRIEGRRPRRAFRYFNKGNVATIGRGKAVADFGRVRFDGRMAWLIWAVVHLYYLVGFDNRLIVMLQWAWTYFTRRGGAQLITGGPLRPELVEPIDEPAVTGPPAAPPTSA